MHNANDFTRKTAVCSLGHKLTRIPNAATINIHMNASLSMRSRRIEKSAANMTCCFQPLINLVLTNRRDFFHAYLLAIQLNTEIWKGNRKLPANGAPQLAHIKVRSMAKFKAVHSDRGAVKVRRNWSFPIRKFFLKRKLIFKGFLYDRAFPTTISH